MNSFPPAKPLYALLLVCAFFTAVSLGQDKTWRPVSQQELGLKAAVAEPDADAEAIFWDVWIDDSDSDGFSMRHYVRVKVFTERGREKYSKFDIPYIRGLKIKDLAARVVRADGTSVEIAEKDIFDREIVKAGGVKVKAKSFAVPNIEPGVIVEYRYKESYSDGGASGMRLAFQRDIPIQSLSYFYKPYNSKEPRFQPYNLQGVKFEKDKKGYWLANRTNVSAFKEEPRMPPEDNVRPWMMLTSTSVALTDASAFSIAFVVKDPSNLSMYWGGVAAEHRVYLEFMKKGEGEIRKVADQVVAGASTQEEKLKRIYEYCQREIRNTSFEPSLTDEERKKLPQIKSVADALKKKVGSSMYVDLLFGAMASSLGMDVRIALAGDRSKMFFNPNMTNEKFVHPAAIGVKVGEDFQLYNPGLKFLPFGMLAWYEEDTYALLVGEKMNQWKETPLSSHDKTKTKRTARLKLLEDGTLEGIVKEEMTGHHALSYRLENHDESAAKREESLRDDVKRRLSTAEVSNVTVENIDDHSKPVVQSYRVRIPSYAQKTGKRLFLQPGFFEYGNNPVFSSSSRKYDIYFRYPWSESDKIEIELPKGFELDYADAPSPLSDTSKISSLDVKLAYDKAAHVLVYGREFYFGGNGKILFPAKSYEPLKSLWDAFHKIDAHTITLKQN